MHGQRKTKTRNGPLLLLCLAGAWISGELLTHHAGPWPSSVRTPGLLDRLCGTGPDGTSGCAGALESKWSAIDVWIPRPKSDLGVRWSTVEVPVAFFGLAYFVFLGVWFAFAGASRSWGKGWRFVPLATVIGGALASVACLWVMLLHLDARCGLCLAIHGINGLLLTGTWMLWPHRGTWMAIGW